ESAGHAGTGRRPQKSVRLRRPTVETLAPARTGPRLPIADTRDSPDRRQGRTASAPEPSERTQAGTRMRASVASPSHRLRYARIAQPSRRPTSPARSPDSSESATED